MSYDFLQPVPQRSIGAQDAENSRIEAIANELHRRCELHEAQRGDSQSHVSSFVFVKDASPTPQIAIDTYMAALGFNREGTIGRYSNAIYTVWDLIPRNVLRDQEGDIFVVDAEIKRNDPHDSHPLPENNEEIGYYPAIITL